MDMDWLKTQFRLHPDKSKADLARALGMEPPAISKILGGTRQIKAHEYLAMRRFFGLPTDGERAAAGKSAAYVLEPLNAGLGERESEDDRDAWVMPANLFHSRTKAPPDKIRIFAVQEDAMVPDFMQGEKILVDLSDTKPSPAGVFIVSDGIGHIIRQCEVVPHSNPPQIRLSARNPRYAPYTAALDKAAIIGRVIAKLQWL